VRLRTVHIERLESRRLLSNAIPVGPEFRVNTYTTNNQNVPSVAMDADGDFVIAWSGAGQSDSTSIFAQRYHATGVPQGDEFRVNTYTTGGQNSPSVAMGADGDFVVAWESNGQDGSGVGVYAQRYNAAGVPQGTEFHVNTYTTNNQSFSKVALDADGFVIAWRSYGQDGSAYGVYAQRYNAVGEPQGDEFRVNTYTTSNQGAPSVAIDADGDFVIAWESWFQDGSNGSVYAQRYNAAGEPQGGEFRVNTYTTTWHLGPSLAMDSNGDFVIAWWSSGQDGSNDGVYAQGYNAAGEPQGDEFRVNTYTTNSQNSPCVAMGADGAFVIAWSGSGSQDGSFSGVYAQCYNASGEPQGGEFRVNTYTTNNQSFSTVALDADGDFVIAWSSYRQDGSVYGVYAQRYAVVPSVAASSFGYATAPHELTFTFDRDVSASLGTDDLVLQNLTTMQTIPSSDFAISYDALTNSATFDYTGTTAGIPGILPDGNYSATLLAAGISTIQGAPLGADYVLSFRFLQGDANGDGRVNLNDFNILAANFGQSLRDFTQGDFDYSGNVNLNDFNILAARFGQVLAGPASPARSTFAGGRAEDGDREDDLADLIG
jgi:hypothetical protein